ATQIRDEIFNNSSYIAVKVAVISCLLPSESSRLKRLTQRTELGSKKPSALLREMQQLAGQLLEENVLNELWVQRLPPNIQALLEVSSHLRLTDGIMERYHPQITAVTNASSPQTTAPTVGTHSEDTLMAAFERAFRRFSSPGCSHCRNHKSYHNSDRRERLRSPSPDRLVNPSRSTYRRYHKRLGEKARRCEAGYTFQVAKQGN
ncbi:hypothetical protein FGIG_11514, partial [Fasciola gigantica]